ncbi:MAG TPA: O-antigen ligase family protein [Candidatus Sulfotelmatobacter sp.]|jgi:O-antigen ligase|nr:O-antigen ligase family protein [Candidatus Sulfotelmatobacter sp.]
MSLLKIFIIILLVLFPFGEILRFPLGNNIDLKPLDVVAVLLFFCSSAVYLKNKVFRKSLKWYYFLFPLIGLISLVINSYWLKPNELFTSFLYLLRWIAYLSVFFAVIQFDDTFKKKISNFLLIDGLIILIIGYVQYFLYPSLRNLYYLGWDEHLYRMFSSFLDPNFVGAFFVIYLFFIAGILFFNIKKFSRKKIVFYSILLFTTLLAIFLTYSRSTLLMLLVSGIAFFILLQRKKFIFFLIGTIVLFVIIISPFFYIENLDLFRINSSIARLETTQHAMRIIQNHPLIGVGFDSYRYAQLRYNFIQSNSQFPSHSASGVDVSLLFVLATTGIIGLLAYCYLWFNLFKNAQQGAKQNPYALIFLASSVGLFVNAVFNNSLFYAEIMFLMWIIAGLMMKKN